MRTASASLFCLYLFTFLLSGCGTRTLFAPRPQAESPLSSKTDELQGVLEKELREDQENFDSLSTKMDEYQGLMTVCETVPENDEAKEFKTACTIKLERLHRELLELSSRLQKTP